MESIPGPTPAEPAPSYTLPTAPGPAPDAGPTPAAVTLPPLVLPGPDGSLAPFDPGARPSRFDARDYGVSALYKAAGDVTAGPPRSATVSPLGPVLTQRGGRCVAYGFAGALQHAIWTQTGKWVQLDADQFFAAGGGNDAYGWEIAQALAWAYHNGIYALDPATHQDAALLKISGYYRVPHTAPDVQVALYQASRHKGWSPLLWETAWPNPWFSPAKGTGLLAPGARDYVYGHLTYLWRYLPRVYGSTDVIATGRNSWGPWGVNGNYEVGLSDVLSPELLWGLWQFEFRAADHAGFMRDIVGLTAAAPAGEG